MPTGWFQKLKSSTLSNVLRMQWKFSHQNERCIFAEFRKHIIEWLNKIREEYLAAVKTFEVRMIFPIKIEKERKMLYNIYQISLQLSEPVIFQWLYKIREEYLTPVCKLLKWGWYLQFQEIWKWTYKNWCYNI